VKFIELKEVNCKELFLNGEAGETCDSRRVVRIIEKQELPKPNIKLLYLNRGLMLTQQAKYTLW